MMFGRGQEDMSRQAAFASTDATSPSGRGLEKRHEPEPHNGCVMSLCNVNGMPPQVLLFGAGEGELTCVH